MIFEILLSVFIVSLISFIGVVALSIKKQMLNKILLYLVSFSAGALLGDSFIHLLPEMAEEYGLTLQMSLFVLSGIVISFIIEKFIHWHHHTAIDMNKHDHHDEHVHPVGFMNLFGDFVHNFIDGMIIAGSYLVSLPVGIATTIAVILHEIPQEIGDFGVLLHAGFTRKKALMFNFFSALGAVVGALIVILLGSLHENLLMFLIPFAIGNFVYIACSDLIPELHKETNVKKSLIQLASLALGIVAMILLIFLE